MTAARRCMHAGALACWASALLLAGPSPGWTQQDPSRWVTVGTLENTEARFPSGRVPQGAAAPAATARAASPKPAGKAPAPVVPAQVTAAQPKPQSAPASRDDLFGVTREEGPAPKAQQAAKGPTRDELFGITPEEPPPAKPEQTPKGPSRDELFGVSPTEAAPSKAPAKRPVTVRGFVEFDPAYTYASPSHWSRAVVRTQVEALGQLGSAIKWKAGLRADVDPVYFDSDFYNDAVKKDQRAELLVRETYLDWSLSDWELRLGRQQIVWGEVVALFVADVVSAFDLRDFILPEFEIMRTPQWAARAERFWKDTHLELVWIPYPTYNNIGEPGAEFYPLQPPVVPGFSNVILDDQRPDDKLSNTNYGLRLSTLLSGWDLSAFYYSSMSAAPTFYRDVLTTPAPVIQFTPRHDRIWQAGGTLTKDFRAFVLRGEAVYTGDKNYEVTDPTAPGGVAQQRALEYIVGLEFLLPHDIRLNLQGYQRRFFDYDPASLFDEVDSAGTLLISGKIGSKLEPQLLWLERLNSDGDRLVRPRIDWLFHPNGRLRLGVDIFNGPSQGFFGRFDNRDRIYGELRYSF